MCSEDPEIRDILESAGVTADPDPAHMLSVRERMTTVGCRYAARRRTRRTLAAAGVLLVGTAAAGLAGTEAGRNLYRFILTPVTPSYKIHGGAVSNPDGSVTTWVMSRSGPGAQPFSPEEAEAKKAKMSELDALREEGAGRLVGLYEGPGIEPGEPVSTNYSVEYTLRNGQTTTVGQGLQGKQAANLRIDEIMKLRDAGEGQLICQRRFPMGLGLYKIRFTLSDGSTVDLKANYPPGPRQEREAIFAETRQLKDERRFTVLNPSAGAKGQLWGTLRYKLVDGRTVGIIEQVPPDMVTPDGKHVMVSENAPAETTSENGDGSVSDKLKGLMEFLSCD